MPPVQTTGPDQSAGAAAQVEAQKPQTRRDSDRNPSRDSSAPSPDDSLQSHSRSVSNIEASHSQITSSDNESRRQQRFQDRPLHRPYSSGYSSSSPQTARSWNAESQHEPSRPGFNFSGSAGVIGRGSSPRSELPWPDSIPSPSASKASPSSLSGLSDPDPSARTLPPPIAQSPPSYATHSDPFRRPSSRSLSESKPDTAAHSSFQPPNLPLTRQQQQGFSSHSVGSASASASASAGAVAGAPHSSVRATVAPRLPTLSGMSIASEPSSSASTSSASPHLWAQHTRSGSESSHSSAAPTPHQKASTSTSLISPSYASRATMYSPSSNRDPEFMQRDASISDSRGTKRKPSPSRGETSEQSRMQSGEGSASSTSPNQQSANQSQSGTATPDQKSGDKGSNKRIKTARACDSCRRKKIRCDVIDDGGPPMGNPNNGNGGLICAHCRQYGFECTFFLPITETRFKKKREREAEEAAAAAAAAAAASGRVQMGLAYGMPHPSYSRPGMMLGQPQSVPFAAGVLAPGVRPSLAQEWPPRDMSFQRTAYAPPAPAQVQATAPLAQPMPQATQPSAKSRAMESRSTKPSTLSPPPDSRVLGPTSIAYIVHSTAFVPGAAIEAHDMKHNQTFEVGTSGDGIIKFNKPPKQSGDATESATGDDEDAIVHIPESLKGRLAGDVVEKLVNTYFEKVATFFPVVTKSEFLHLSRPPPLLLYAICGVSALSREVPREVLGAVKATLHAIFKDNDILSNSSSVTVRALLVMSLHSDLHGSNALQSGSKCWNRTGMAIRMAQDLGLNRDASGRDDLDDDAFFLEQKRRIWGCCVTADRCLSVSLGRPLAIDLTDCDVRLPSPFEILRSPTDPKSDLNTDRPFAFNTEMLKLTILIGRVMKAIYSPTGLMKATDEEITSLLSDIDRWKESLPAELQFQGPDSNPAAGILHVGFACLMMLFWRVFMRISYVCPTHLTFSLTIERMTALIRYSSESIAWVEKNDFYLDTMQIVSYSLVFSATVQYHAWVRRGDQSALGNLKKLRDIMMRYRKDDHLKQDDLTVRGKTAEVISLLYESASGAYANSPCSGQLNPTAGVTNRKSKANVQNIVFKADASRPGGGVFVTTDQNLVLRDLPKGTIILQETKDGSRIPALVRTSLDQNGGWQTYEQYRQALAAAAKQGMNQAQAEAAANGTLAVDAAAKGGDGSATSMAQTTSIAAGTDQGSVPSLAFSLVGSSDGSNQPPPADNLTHLAGDVWQDAEGRLVNRRGSRLLTMVPISPGLASTGLPGDQSFVGSGGQQLQVGRNTILPSDPNFNFNPHLNDGFWAPAEFVFDSNGQLGSNGAANVNFDTLLLDSLPGQPLDFANWDAYFSKLNQPTGGSNDAGNRGAAANVGSGNSNGLQAGQVSSMAGEGSFATTSLGIEAQLMDPSIRSNGGF